MPPARVRFTEEEFGGILRNNDAENTKKAIKKTVNVSRGCLREKNLLQEFKALDIN